MGRKTSNNADQKENQLRVLEFFWNYIFDSKKSSTGSYLDQTLAQKAVNSFGEILRLSNKELIVTFFGRLIDSLRNSESGYLCINAIAEFLRLFFNKDNFTRTMLVE